MNGYTLSVSQLNDRAAVVLQSDPLLSDVSVKGEIGSYKRHSSGHIYFSLKDNDASVSCVMFKNAALMLAFSPREGMRVTVSGYVSVYQRDGRFQLYARSMRKEGEGELFARFLELKAKLESEGMFDAAHKRALPLLPKAVGAVTSATGAVIQDIRNVAARRFPAMPIVLYPAPVQGSDASSGLIASINKANAEAACDVLIVGRGGGSMEDLFCFNDEALARTIYASHIPIVSAVGHETDFTIADFVADMRAPTPSAAAELCVPELDALTEGIYMLAEGIKSNARAALMHANTALAAASGAGFEGVTMRVTMARATLLSYSSTIDTAIGVKLSSARASTEAFSAQLEALSPAAVLKRGYAMVKKNSTPIGDISGLSPGDVVSITMNGGEATAGIYGIQSGTEVFDI